MTRRIGSFILASLVISALLVAPTAASAQTPQLFTSSSPFMLAKDAPASPESPLFGNHSGMGIGVKGGALFPSLTGNTTFKSRTGLIAGIFFGGNRPGLVGVQAEVLYAEKRAGASGSPVTGHYLEIPVLMRINIGGLYGVIGPYADIKLKTSGLNVSDNFNGSDFGLVAGVGVEFAAFLIEIRENIGFRNVTDTSHARSFAVLAGIRFN